VVITGTTVSAAGATRSAGPAEAAALVQQLHDALRGAADAGDVDATKATLDELEPLLADMESGQRFALEQSSRDLATAAGDEAATTSAQVDELFPADREKTDQPSVAQQLNALVQRLLQSLSVLADNLLGGVRLSV
jgi:hypothetical protein